MNSASKPRFSESNFWTGATLIVTGIVTLAAILFSYFGRADDKALVAYLDQVAARGEPTDYDEWRQWMSRQCPADDESLTVWNTAHAELETIHQDIGPVISNATDWLEAAVAQWPLTPQQIADGHRFLNDHEPALAPLRELCRSGANAYMIPDAHALVEAPNTWASSYRILVRLAQIQAVLAADRGDAVDFVDAIHFAFWIVQCSNTSPLYLDWMFCSNDQMENAALIERMLPAVALSPHQRQTLARDLEQACSPETFERLLVSCRTLTLVDAIESRRTGSVTPAMEITGEGMYAHLGLYDTGDRMTVVRHIDTLLNQMRTQSTDDFIAWAQSDKATGHVETVTHRHARRVTAMRQTIARLHS